MPWKLRSNVADETIRFRTAPGIPMRRIDSSRIGGSSPLDLVCLKPLAVEFISGPGVFLVWIHEVLTT